MTDYEKMKQLFTELNIEFNDQYEVYFVITQIHDHCRIIHHFDNDGKYLESETNNKRR